MSKHRPPAPAARSSAGPLLVLLGGAGLLIAALAFAFWPKAAPASPTPAAPATSAKDGVGQLQVDRELVDLGDVKLGEWVQAEFQITNAGAGPLTFTEPPYIELVEGC